MTDTKEKKPTRRHKKKETKVTVAPQAVVETSETTITPETKAEIREAVKEAELSMESVTAELTKEVTSEMTVEYENLKKELDEAKEQLAEAKAKAEEVYNQYKSLSKSKQKYILTVIGFAVGVCFGLAI